MSATPSLNYSSFAEMYEHVLVSPLFSRWVDDLFQRTRLTAGDRVLDVACGTGIVARQAQDRVGPSVRVIGVDPNAAMLAVARQVAPEIDWREGNATSLPIGDGQVDVVFCQQGLQFVPDKLAAVRDMRRVLAAGGRIAVATWVPIEDVPLCRDMHAVAERHLGPIVDQRHSFGIAADLQALLTDAGFHDVRTEPVSRTVRFKDPAPFFQMNAGALTSMSAAGKNMADAERGSVAALIATECNTLLPRYGDGSLLSFELSAVVATGRA